MKVEEGIIRRSLQEYGRFSPISQKESVTALGALNLMVTRLAELEGALAEIAYESDRGAGRDVLVSKGRYNRAIAAIGQEPIP